MVIETDFGCYMSDKLRHITKPRYSCEFSCYVIIFKYDNGDENIEFYDTKAQAHCMYNEVVEELRKNGTAR